VETSCGFWKRINRPVFWWSIVALNAELLIKHLPRSIAELKFIALLPVLPLLMFIPALIRTIRKMDEMQRRICLEASSIAFALALVFSIVVDALAEAGVYQPKFIDTGTLLLLLWGCAFIFTSLRYK